ncbi:hypothetical protein [Skermania piniformis]|uniref:Uncharacterized protein n=1 Tax=Skermania pinensis TaxID=39122 RepID=A0ABX8SBT0_9ACTN|nr:hypothetical protein [Skermania piniformis]QXQ15323.1 hypothetical protein KV203_08440 [Skermania piniformis]
MSGPKGISYRIAAEQRAAEAAQARRVALEGRARAFTARCVAAGHPELGVSLGPARAGSAETNAACDELERRLLAAEAALTERSAADRNRELFAGMQSALDKLAQREQAEAAARTERVADPPPAPARHDHADEVQRVLATLAERSTELEAAGHALLFAAPERARLLLRDLSARVTEANRRTEGVRQLQSEIAALHGRAQLLDDPGPVLELLARAESTIGDPAHAESLLDAARELHDRRRDHETPERDRRFVAAAVTASLQELGYIVADVELETSESLVLLPPGNATHAVRAVVADGEIDLRTVRLVAGTDRAEDRGAEQALCADLPAFTSGLQARGVAATVTRQVPAGVVSPRLLTRKVAGETRSHRRRTTRERSAD